MENLVFPGDRVAYVPNHANGDINHPDTQKGTVSTVERKEDGTQKVWVRYTEGSTGVLTPTKNLVIL